MTTHIPKEDPKKVDIPEQDQLAKLQTNNSLMRTKSRRESNPNKKILNNENETSSPTMMRHRKSFIDDDLPREICIQVPQNYVETDSSNPEFNIHSDKTPIMLRIRYSIWLKIQFIYSYEFKFALKMAAAVLILCIPAFVPDSIGWYTSVRGQWAPMTVIAIMNPTR